MNDVATIAESGAPVLMPSVLHFLHGSPKKLLIGGNWVPAKSGKTFEMLNPATEEVLIPVADGDKPDVDDAVRAARRTFEAGKWPRMSPHESMT